MCRLYAQRSELASSAEDPLCSSPNALRFQSHKHPHGWGVAWYQGGVPFLRRGVLPAHEDDAFREAAGLAHSHVVIAHVRDASVGGICADNTHPFLHDRWIFAHNGTVARFKASDRVRARVESEIDPELRSLLCGETDSERCFFVFLSRIRAQLAPGASADLATVRAALADTTRAVRDAADDASHRSSLNFVVSDGRLVAACRRGRDLVFHLRTEPSRLFVVASEIVGGEGWDSVPEDGFVGVDDAFRVDLRALHPAQRAA
jgi:glutamine amidotransferase